MKELMLNKRTKDKSVDAKLVLMKRKFGDEVKLSRSTLWNVSYLVKLLIF